MTTLRRLWLFLTRWRRVQELDEEMRLHVEMRAAAIRRNGVPPDEALRAARRRFGNPLKLREESRDAWGFLEIEQIGRDVHFAVRQMVRRPLSSIVVMVTLALGVGANTAVFSLIDTLLFRPAARRGDNRALYDVRDRDICPRPPWRPRSTDKRAAPRLRETAAPG